MSFTPVPITFAMSGSIFIGVLNAVPTFVVLLVLNLFVLGDDEGMSIGMQIGAALMIGVLGTCLTMVMNRHEQVKQQKTVPHGALVALAEVAGMTVAGAVIAPLMVQDPRSVWVGAVAGLLGCAPSFLITSPWKESASEQEFQARNKQFARMTVETLEEQREDVRHKQQEKLRKVYGDPWDQSSRQDWWK
ncbi:DUF2029 domain-containing protein [Rothia halotolerans]|uniref:DUF2029 domain-containing protein n=1 Tax=Rothia halotolerans TaxID=405770 RepID=UPI00101C08FB|nr:DUF2029 domain-containing protein [Rothia halotolerans]